MPSLKDIYRKPETLNEEQVEDIISSFIVPTTGLTKVYDDINNILFLNPHEIIGGSNITVTYNNDIKNIEIEYIPPVELNPSYLLNRTNHTGIQSVTTITGLATVATSGNYNDLTNKPTIYTEQQVEEQVEDIISTFIETGAGLTKTYDDLNNQLFLNPHQVVGGSNVTVTYNNTLKTIAIDYTPQPNAIPSYLLNRANHTGTQPAVTITGLSTVSTTGQYSDLLSKPTLGSAASRNVGTLTNQVLVFNEDNKLPALDGSLLTNLGIGGSVNNAENLNNQPGSYYLDRTNHTGIQNISTISGLGTAASKNTGTGIGNVLIFSEAGKLPALDGSLLTGVISTASNAETLNNLDSLYYLNRTNHTGTQPVSTITGLGLVATSNNYVDLINRPTLGTAAQYNVGTLAGQVLLLAQNNRLPALDGSLLTNINNANLLDNLDSTYFLNRNNHTGTQNANTISGLSAVATSNNYNDLSNKPTLGTAASKNTGTDIGQVLMFSEAGKLPSLDGSLLTGLIMTSVNADTLDNLDSTHFINRANHTGTQSVNTITGLGLVATSNNYVDLINRPTLGTASSKDTGTLTGQVLMFSEAGKLPALDGSLLTGVVSTNTNADTLDNLDSLYYLNRANHTGTQGISTITGLGSAAVRQAGTLTGQVLLLAENNKLPALDGSLLTNIVSSGSNADTLDSLDSTYFLNRTNHTGTQLANTITGLGLVATSNNYNDLSDKPTLGTASSKDTGTLAGNVLMFANDDTLPVLDGSNLIGVIASNSNLLAGELGSYYINRANHLGTQPVSTISGLGTAATKNSGTLAGEVLLLSENNKLPVLDGSLLTNLPTVGGGYSAPSSVTTNSSFTLNNTFNNKWILASGNITITAPASFGEFYCTVQNTSTGIITLNGISNSTGTLLLTQWQYCVIYSNGINWYSIGDLDFRERIQDLVANFLTAGTGINLNYDDNSNSLTINSTGSVDMLPVSVSTNYTLQASDHLRWIKATGNITITVGTQVNYFQAIIQNVGTGTITLAGFSPGNRLIGTKLTVRWTACHVYYEPIDGWTAVGALTV